MRCVVGCGHVHPGSDTAYGLDVVRGDPSHPVNNGLACGRDIRESVSPGGSWLTRPLVRENGELRQTSWSDAFSRAGDAISDVMADNPDEVAVLGSGQRTNEAIYTLGKLARGGIGTRYYDANATLCMVSAVTVYYRAFGSDAPPPTYDDIPEAETHLVWGASLAVAHPMMFRWIHQSADDGDLVAVDPVETKTAGVADDQVAIDPGDDLALAQAILGHLVGTDRVDEVFVEEHTEGFDRVINELPPVEEAASEAGVALDEVEKLASLLDVSTLIYWGMGINQGVRGVATVGALVSLCLASGNFGPGSDPFSLTRQASSMDTRVVPSKGTWPSHRPFEHPDHRRIVAGAQDVPVPRLPDDNEPEPIGMFEPSPSVVWIVATNPFAGFPDATAAREIPDNSLLAVQDVLRSETVGLTDVVLPATTWGGSEGTTMNMEWTVLRARPVTETPPDVRQDLDIIADVAARVAPGLLPRPSVSPSELFDEFAALTEGTDADCSGLLYAQLDGERAVRWPVPDPTSKGGYRYYDGTDGESDDPTWSFPTASGKAQFSAFPGSSLPEPADESYPPTLTTGREADGYSTGIRTRSDTPDQPVARAHPDTIDAHRDIVVDPEDDRRATIVSRRTSVPATLDPDDAVPPGLVWLFIHHPMTNRLTSPAVDPQSDEPNFKQCAVRLEYSETTAASDRLATKVSD